MPPATEQLETALAELAAMDVGLCTPDALLGPRTTWRIGGPARLLVEPSSVEQLAQAVRYLSMRDVPGCVIGRGSNLLIDDAGVAGVVVVLGARMARVQWDGPRVTVQAGVSVPRLALQACQRGLSGLEHTAGIPGAIGGLIAMNGGSERQAIGSVVRELTVVDQAGQIHTMGPEQCDFAYRTSVFQRMSAWVARAVLELQPRDQGRIRETMRQILASRRRKFPRRAPSCGSVFLNDPAVYERFGPPGKVVEQTGCKGWRAGGVEVSRLHANFMVNTGAATAADVLELIRRVRRAVFQRTGLWLRCEVRHLGSDGRLRPAHEAAGE
jgi:UDP-N-acetylmuramate dehydrogenase